MPLSATAAGSASAGTCSLTDACQAGPNRAIPLPIMKQNRSSKNGVIRSKKASIVSASEPASAIAKATSPTTRRSNISAKAPAGVETSATGSINAVCTNATISAEEVIRVIAQAAPTPIINRPRFDNRLAVQIRLNTACLNGERIPVEVRARGSSELFIAQTGFPELIANLSCAEPFVARRAPGRHRGGIELALPSLGA